MYVTSSAIQVAQSQVGYHEGKKGSHWDNVQKYASFVGFTNGLAWCDTFMSWVWSMTGVEVADNARSASCAQSVAAYKKAGRFTEYPGDGFQVFYGEGGGAHTGLVTSWDADKIHTIEGNTNDNGSAEGDGVYAKTRARRDNYVYGYGIPYYSSKCRSADPKWNGKSLKK